MNPKWKKTPLKELYKGFYDGPHATPKTSESGAIFLGIKNISKDGRLDLSNIRYISEDDMPKWTKRVTPQKNDIVFSYEATLHRYALIPDNFRGCLGRRMALIRVDEKKANINFLFSYFLSPIWRCEVEKHMLSGATVDRIPITNVPKFTVFLPPLPTQQKIAQILSAYDDLIENNLKRIKLLEEMAQITYEQWFVRMKFPSHETTPIDAETGLPEGWKKRTCFDVMDVLSGGTPKTTNEEFWGGNIQFFTPKDATTGFYTKETEKKITKLGLVKCNSKLYPKNTLFITARGTVGKLNLASEAMAMNQSCYALRAKEGLTQYFLYCSLSKTINAFKGAANGGVFDTIVVDTFKFLPFIQPAQTLIDTFDLKVNPLFNSVQNLLKQNQHLKEARDILLPRLMTGMIDVDKIKLPTLKAVNTELESA